MTQLATTAATLSDADLVAASRSGDRTAFSQIVRRYQAMVSGLIYAACGDLHRSEDVAQETFISAWKSLSGLRDAAKLPGWLCQIARRRLADASRKSSATEVPFMKAFASGEQPQIAAGEGAQAASAEECELLWQTLSRIPQPYRETLVLFYRQGQSTAQVAAATESSEAAVRQRLTRGRQLLRDEMAAAVERNLARTAPTNCFTQKVVAALPVGVSATAKSAAAIKGGGLLAGAMAWLAPLAFFLEMIFATVQDIRLSTNPRQRRMNIIQSACMWSVIGVWVVAFNLMIAWSREHMWPLSTVAWTYSAGGAIFGMALFAAIVFPRWRMEKILREENVAEAPFPQMPFWKRMGITIPVVAISIGWLVRIPLDAGDHFSVQIIAAIIVLESMWFAWRLPRLQPENPIQQTFETFTLALAAIVVMLNWKLPEWIATTRALDLNQMPNLLPMSAINLCALGLFVWITALKALSRREERYGTPGKPGR